MIGETYEKAYLLRSAQQLAVALNLRLQQFSPGARRDIILYIFSVEPKEEKKDRKKMEKL